MIVYKSDDGFRILAYKSVYTDTQGEAEAYRYYVLDERGHILEEHGEGIEEEGGGYYNGEAQRISRAGHSR